LLRPVIAREWLWSAPVDHVTTVVRTAHPPAALTIGCPLASPAHTVPVAGRRGPAVGAAYRQHAPHRRPHGAWPTHSMSTRLWRSLRQPNSARFRASRCSLPGSEHPSLPSQTRPFPMSCDVRHSCSSSCPGRLSPRSFPNAGVLRLGSRRIRLCVGARVPGINLLISDSRPTPPPAIAADVAFSSARVRRPPWPGQNETACPTASVCPVLVTTPATPTRVEVYSRQQRPNHAAAR
jgi:hypothetical protein